MIKKNQIILLKIMQKYSRFTTLVLIKFYFLQNFLKKECALFINVKDLSLIKLLNSILKNYFQKLKNKDQKKIIVIHVIISKKRFQMLTMKIIIKKLKRNQNNIFKNNLDIEKSINILKKKLNYLIIMNNK